MHERGRLQRLVRLALARETGPRELPQFVIHFRQQARPKCRGRRRGCRRLTSQRRIMTPEAIAQVRASYAEVAARPRQLAVPLLRRALHRRAAPAAAVSRRSHVAPGTFRSGAGARDPESGRSARPCTSRCGSSARSTCTGARVRRTTCSAREALIARHPRARARVERRRSNSTGAPAITAIIVPMLEGAAVDTAVWAERLATGVPEIE